MIGLCEIQGTIPISWNKSDIPVQGWTYNGDVDNADLYVKSGHLQDQMVLGMMPRDDKNFPDVLDFRNHFPNLRHKEAWLQRLNAGRYLPNHSDSFRGYLKRFGITNVNECVRIIIFLEDWHNGQISDINDTLIYKWSAGDYVGWYGLTPHAVYNFSDKPRIVAQVTGYGRV